MSIPGAREPSTFAIREVYPVVRAGRIAFLRASERGGDRGAFAGLPALRLTPATSVETALDPVWDAEVGLGDRVEVVLDPMR